MLQRPGIRSDGPNRLVQFHASAIKHATGKPLGAPLIDHTDAVSGVGLPPVELTLRLWGCGLRWQNKIRAGTKVPWAVAGARSRRVPTVTLTCRRRRLSY